MKNVPAFIAVHSIVLIFTAVLTLCVPSDGRPLDVRAVCRAIDDSALRCWDTRDGHVLRFRYAGADAKGYAPDTIRPYQLM